MSLRSCLLLLAWAGCAPSDPGSAILPGAVVGPPDSGHTGLVDADGDGSPAGTDCDDTNPFASPDNLGVYADRCNGFDEDCDGVVDEDCPVEFVRLGDDGSYAYFYAPSITTSSYDHCDGLDARSPSPASLQDETIESFVLSGVAAHHAADTAGAPDTLMTGLYHLTFFGNDANGDPEFVYLRDLDPIDPVVSPWAPGQPTLLGVGTAEYTAIDLATGEYSVIDHTETRAVACETECVVRYLDADGDGDGNAAVSFTVCGENPDNAVSNSVDCDDADPGIGEICDPTADEDGDGSLAIDDCDDNDPWTFPGAYDRCDYYSEDCNVTGDEACALNSTYLLMTFDTDGFEVVTYEGSGYYLNADNQSWTAARAECQVLGGDLWVIDSETERTLVQAVTDDLAFNDDYWFGAWDENGDDDWRWVDGTDLSETDPRWFGNDPITDADCGRFFASYADAPFLSEVCGGNRDSMCEVSCDTYYLDLDRDGIGRDGDTRIFCGTDVPSYVASVGGDCDDLDDTVGDSVWYVDEDGDGFHGTAYDQCDAPEGDAVIQEASEDCDEADVTINVANTVDTCNGLDDDCDGTVDENCACTWVEGDGTGYLFCSVALWTEDAEQYCNDQGGTLVVMDDATENTTVTGLAMGISSERWHIGGTDAAVEGTWLGGDGSPLPYENWNGNEPNDGNGSGEDCIELRPDGFWNDVTCDDRLNPFVCELPCADWYADEDGDGYSGSTFVRTHCGATNAQASTTPDEDCDDGDAAISPAAVEICDPLDVDEDCDGLADDADSSVTGTFTWFVDADGDGFGGEDVVEACEEPAAATIDSSDCDDDDPDVRPDAVETCNGVDDDCDEATDEDQVDGDGDGVCDAVDPCPLDAPDDLNRDGLCDSAFAVQPAGFWPGQTTTLVVVNAPPSTRVYFGASRVGEGTGPCLTADDGSSVCVGLASIVGLGTAMSDAAGNAFLQVTTPASFSSGDPVWIQALHLDGSGATTPVMSQTVQ